MAIEVQDEYSGKSNKILSSATMHQMLTHQKADWGLGFALESPGHKLRFSHGGSNEGFRCTLQAYTEAPGQGIVIMTNGDQGWNLLNEILRSVAKEYGWPDFHPQEHAVIELNSSQLSAFTGSYATAAGARPIVVTQKDGRLFVQMEAIGPDAEQLLPEADGHFFVVSAPLEFEFQKDKKGIANQVTVKSDFQTSVAKKAL